MRSEHLEMVKYCDCMESRMSDWETDFVADMADRLDSGRSLTERQAEKLEEIWDKVTNGG